MTLTDAEVMDNLRNENEGRVWHKEAVNRGLVTMGGKRSKSSRDKAWRKYNASRPLLKTERDVMDRICADISAETGLSKNDILSKRRLKALVAARVELCISAYEMNVPLVAIGKYLGHADHTTVLHHVRKGRA